MEVVGIYSSIYSVVACIIFICYVSRLSYSDIDSMTKLKKWRITILAGPIIWVIFFIYSVCMFLRYVCNKECK